VQLQAKKKRNVKDGVSQRYRNRGMGGGRREDVWFMEVTGEQRQSRG
jgi:hypothetical protein